MEDAHPQRLLRLHACLCLLKLRMRQVSLTTTGVPTLTPLAVGKHNNHLAKTMTPASPQIHHRQCLVGLKIVLYERFFLASLGLDGGKKHIS